MVQILYIISSCPVLSKYFSMTSLNIITNPSIIPNLFLFDMFSSFATLVSYIILLSGLTAQYTTSNNIGHQSISSLPLKYINLKSTWGGGGVIL
jgi:hypothetical protein